VIEENEIPSTDSQSSHTVDTRPGSRAGSPCGQRLRPLPADAQIGDEKESTHVPN